MNPEIDSKAAFARRIGVTPQRSTQLVDRGMPVRPDGSIDVNTALAWLDENLDTSKRVGGKRVGGKHAGSTWPADAPATIAAGPSLAEAKRIHELVKVQRARLALERERGDLVSRNEVKVALFAWGRQERDSWLAWCRRVVPLIAAETGANAGTLFAALDRHIREHLNDLAEPTIDVS